MTHQIKPSGKTLLYIALLAALFFHGSALIVTFNNTFDAYVHMFFGDHYAKSWFEPWEFRWYTGFPTLSYPPLVHQIIGLLSLIGGLEFGFISWSLLMIGLFVIGIYRFSLLFVSDLEAGVAAILAVFSTAMLETIHVFGQLPTLTGMAFLLNALPEIYQWFRYGRRFRFYTSITLLAIVTGSHHVTTIFGMVFFVAPIIVMAVWDKAGGTDKDAGLYKSFFLVIRGIRANIPRLLLFGTVVIGLIVLILFPYWYWSKTDPISQVSIHHATRDSFIKNSSAGFIFFIVPWGAFLLFLPYIFRNLLAKRTFFVGLSFSLLFLLGTGGTTPLPRWMLGESAFNILTLDRFTIWASIMALPIAGKFVYSLLFGTIRGDIVQRFGKFGHRISSVIMTGALILPALFVTNLSNFRPMQPEKIEMQPITNFINKDKHDRWRYLTLGFGDQMAWLSTQTHALTVDGNYHSARRLPELTSRAVERLENSKFSGIAGLGSLQQFLTISDKYNLKYIYSNDKFYDPLLFFCGWQRIQRLENGIVVWEKPDITPLATILPRKQIPKYQKIMWGTLPMATLLIGIWVNLILRFRNGFRSNHPEYRFYHVEENLLTTGNDASLIHRWWFLLALAASLIMLTMHGFQYLPQTTPEKVIKNFYDNLDFNRYEDARALYLPENRPSTEQFALERSAQDGILASYGKLQNIQLKEVTNEYEKTGYREYEVQTDWITPLMIYTTTQNHRLIKEKGKWYLEHKVPDIRIPPDQYYSIENVDFKNHGRRSLSVDATNQEDILDRPELNIEEANLIYRDGRYHVVGVLQNIDDYPAYLTIESILYDSMGRELTRYSTKDVVIHKLLPKEKTPFRVDFESIAWKNRGQKPPSSFEPLHFSAETILQKPASFIVQVKSLVTDNELYKHVGMMDVVWQEDERVLHGVFENYGVQEIAVPQVLSTYTNADNHIEWVGVTYIDKSIRPQMNRHVEIPVENIVSSEIVISGNNGAYYVNGLPNKDFSYAQSKMGKTTNQPSVIAIKEGKIQLFVHGFVPNIVN